MGRWLLLQIGRAGLAAWATASLLFVLSRVVAGGAENMVLGELSDFQVVATDTSANDSQHAAKQALSKRLGLNEPVFYVTRVAPSATAWRWHGTHNQYHHWLTDLLHGRLGLSFRDGQPIGPRLRSALVYTLPLTGAAAIVATATAVVLGLFLAEGALPGTDKLSRGRAGLQLLLTGLQSIPVLMLALGMLFLFANPDALNILSLSSFRDGVGSQLSTYAIGLLLPLLTLVLAVLPELTLPLAAALRHELSTDYAVTARAKGVSTRQLLRQHALPNALLPLLTSFAGLLPTLLAGTVLVETVFSLPGMGRLLAEAAAGHDYPVVVAGVLLTAIARLLALTLADILYAMADPRIRLAA